MVILQGTTGNDTLTGTSGNDYLYGHGGADTLRGGGGGDWLEAVRGRTACMGARTTTRSWAGPIRICWTAAPAMIRWGTSTRLRG